MNDRERPDRPTLEPMLRRVVEAIGQWSGDAGHPTLDEVAGIVGCAKSTVSKARRRLQELGLVQFDPRARRSTRLTSDPAAFAAVGLEPPAPPDGTAAALTWYRSRRARLGGTRASQRPAAHRGEPLWPLTARPPRRLPLAGPIAAGPARSFHPDEGTVEVDGELAGPGQYALRVSGDSMVELGILDGDHAIVDPRQPVHHGDVVAALLPSEHGDEDLATLKILELQRDEAWLVAANPAYAPIPLRRAEVLGRVTTTIRRF
jgi:SOS-response transcriptional repressor LexA